MIRNVVMGRIDDPARAPEVQAGLDGIASLRLDGLLDMRIARDAGLRESNWSFVIINDWADADAYRAYDADEEHNRYRAMIANGCGALARVQVEL